jgi:MFS family permease
VPLASWYALGVLILIHVFGYVDRIALTILMDEIGTDLRLSDQQLGLLTGLAFALFYAAFGVPLARVADRTTRVTLIAACLSLWSVMTALSGMARNFTELFLARVGVGIGEAGCVPPAHSAIGDYFPHERRTFAISLYSAGAVVGTAGGLFAVGALAENIGWRGSMIVIGLAGLPLALLMILTVREPARPRSHESQKETAWTSIGALLRRPAFLHLALAFSIGDICSQGFGNWSPAFLIRSFGMGMAEVGAWTGLSKAIGGVAGILSGGLLATWLIPRDRRWELWIPTAALAICTPLFVVMILSPWAWLVVALMMVISFFGAMSSSVAIAAVQSFAEPHRRATAVSLVLFLASLLGGGLGPYLIGLISDLLKPAFGNESLRYALLLSCVMLAWGTLHYAIASRRVTHDLIR